MDAAEPGKARRFARRRGQRPLRETLSSALPLVSMLLLALASWWLVQNAPGPPGPAVERPLNDDPDYTMTVFAIERFDAQGRLKLRIQGDRMRHFPTSDRTEIEAARIRSVAPDGRVTLAEAQRAVGNGDGTEVQLIGGAEVRSADANGAPLSIRSEFIHLFLNTQQVKSHRPVQVVVAGNQVRAAGLAYDHAARRLELTGPMRAQLTPRVAAAPRPPPTSPP